MTAAHTDPADKKPARAGWRAALFTVVFGLLLGGFAVEATARWVLDRGMDFDLEMWKYARDLKRVSANPAIGHEHQPGTSGTYMGVPVRINSQGLRDREFAPAPPAGVTRVVMLGDSVTFGWGVRDADTPSKLLESALNTGLARPAWEVMNTGVGNYNTAMEVAWFFDHGPQLKPDIVVLNYFINDAEPTPRRKEAGWRQHSYAAVMFYSAIDKVDRQYFGKADWKRYYGDLYRVDAPGWRAAQQAVGRLARWCRENNVRLLIANYPELHALKPYPFQPVTDAVAQMAAANNVPFVDLRPGVEALKPETLWVSPTDAHPNRTANLRFAAQLRQAVLQSAPGTTPAPNLRIH